MGPNLYVSPGGGFTHLHQDGHGTVDSGHLDVMGFNEVIMLRRMPAVHKRNACRIVPGASENYDALYGKPHDTGGDIVVSFYKFLYCICANNCTQVLIIQTASQLARQCDC